MYKRRKEMKQDELKNIIPSYFFLYNKSEWNKKKQQLTKSGKYNGKVVEDEKETEICTIFIIYGF